MDQDEDVAKEIDLVRQLRDVHLEALLHIVEGLGVRLVRHQGDGQALGTEPGQKKLRKSPRSKLAGIMTDLPALATLWR